MALGAHLAPEAVAEANNEVFDKLISIFRERSRDENRKLIAHSKQWPTLAEGVFYRLEELTKRSASNLREQAKLRNLLRSIRNIHQEYKRYRAITKKFEESPEEDWEGLVAHNHEYMQGPFFEFWERTLSSRDQTEEQAQANAAIRVPALAPSSTELAASRSGVPRSPPKISPARLQPFPLPPQNPFPLSPRRAANAAMLSRVAALVTAMQKAAADEQSLQDAGSRFHSLLEKINSLEDADKEIDSLQREGKLDPALMLTMAKAYSGVKESPYVKEEVKDIMAHLYFKAKESAARDQPPEVRILKHLLTIEGSRELREALDQAFTPPEDGAPSEGAEQDYLFTTPPKLTQYVDSILVAYDTQREGTNLLGQTAKLMDPAVITRLRDIGQLIRRSYM
eukprot:CAMPEP_0177625346 /NCGR_PEP_ID=MMETSP0419_2-20121207/30045_1 /TAXON_ID=582737 /ORGANISM="Tetraselmis sp., Strain GSL018" /LENGTH=395 /DNA_ID=CAMNT_0019126275 /DNA_START=277 /DNA_END=1466 /DNA_ORIENTATION=+